jgi:hypothetical protein
MTFSASAVRKFSGPREVERTIWKDKKKYLLDCSVANIAIFITKGTPPVSTSSGLVVTVVVRLSS